MKLKQKLAFAFFTLIFFLSAGSIFCADVYSRPDFFPEDQRNLVILDYPHEYDLNPLTASYSSEAQILTGLYEGLFSYNPNTLEPEYAICSSYKISRDKKRWTFTLREDAKFSDGEAITAYSIRDSWLRLLSTEDAPFASLLDCIQGAEEFRTGQGEAEQVRITARDNTTLVVHLREPAEHLPSILCHHSFCATSSKPNVYSGPFMLKFFRNGVLKMVRNPYYHDATSVVIPGITIVQTDDAEENTHLYNIGVVDWLLADVDANKILNSESVHVNADFGTTYIFFKNRGGIWDNSELRAALLEAIPYDKLRGMFSIQASTLVYPLSGYPTVAGLKDYDEEDAKLMMQDARKKAGIPQDKTLDIVFGIYESPVMRFWAQTLKEAWKPLGVNLITQTVSIEDYNPSIPYWNADLFTYSWIGDYADPLAFLELFRGKSTLNVANYSNPDYDSLLSEAAQTTVYSDRYRLLSKAEQLLLDDSMVIPISHSVSLNVINLYNIGGWQSNPLDIHPYRYLYIRRNRKRIPNSI